jgi:hypothetical protein
MIPKVERYYDARGLLHMRMISFMPPEACRNKGECEFILCKNIYECYIMAGLEREMSCIYCGCTDDDACPGGCGWIVPFVCSSCKDRFYGPESEYITLGYVDWIPDDMKIDQIEFLAENFDKDLAIGFVGEKLMLYSVTITESS